jgi:hypothetical protein
MGGERAYDTIGFDAECGAYDVAIVSVWHKLVEGVGNVHNSFIGMQRQSEAESDLQ